MPNRYERVIERIEADKRQRLVKLQTTYSDLDRRINVLKDRDDKIGKVEGDQATVRSKETEIEVYE